jgi:hypothetical protein
MEQQKLNKKVIDPGKMKSICEVEQQIISYLSDQSRGVIRLTTEAAKHIVEIVIGRHSPTAKLFRWDANLNSWIHRRTEQTTMEEINKQIMEHLGKKDQPDKFYKWDMYNCCGEFEGSIFTLNLMLF